MSYLFRHLQMGGPPMANIEIIREPGGRVVFLGYSPAISERLSSNWCAVMNEAYHRLVAEWPGDPSEVIVRSDNFRISGLVRKDQPDEIVVPYHG